MATEDQPTFVSFLSCRDDVDCLARGRQSAGELAVATGAPVLTVACSTRGYSPFTGAVEQGTAAYAWLLGEGSDSELTAVIPDLTSASLVSVAGQRHGTV